MQIRGEKIQDLFITSQVKHGHCASIQKVYKEVKSVQC